MENLVRGCGVALVIGGVLLILVNTVLTPMMLAIDDEVVMRTSDVYLVRLSLAWVTALMFLIGCIGVHIAQRDTAGVFGVAAFLLAFVGNGLLLCVEWSNVFVLRALAQTAPQALDALDAATLLNIGFASAVGFFALGWLLLAISILLCKALSRWAAIAIIAGLLLMPALGASPLEANGLIIANVVLGLGIILLGRSVAQAA